MNKENNTLLTRQEVADRWQCCTATIRRRQASGQLPAVIFSQNSIRYRLEDVMKVESGNSNSGVSTIELTIKESAGYRFNANLLSYNGSGPDSLNFPMVIMERALTISRDDYSELAQAYSDIQKIIFPNK
ncbi:MAG: hypothetical protein CMI54_05610 [Parcubacteria group bacterium]|jgi:hypothetical protein|nr:hypothetical protein [Parcubacteria group bacterium]|tara:strand:+ start:4208 stop:4597 length:390 start_codon:yes stop_codon:yes gene_type:complete